MKKLMAGCLALVLGAAVLGIYLSGCGTNATSPAPVTNNYYLNPTATPLCATPSTYGVTVVGFSQNASAGYMVADPVTLSVGTAAVSLSLYFKTGLTPTQIRYGIYNNNAGAPATLVVQTGPQNIVQGAWNTVAIPDVYLPAGVYWLAYLCATDSPVAFGNPGGPIAYETNAIYGWAVLPNVFPAATISSFNDSSYLSTCP